MKNQKNLLITGGAGFIGANSVDYFLTRGDRVVIFDNLSRKGADANLAWLSKKWKKNFQFVKGDVVYHRDALNRLARRADAILHFAGQVAVTTSVENPRMDFLVNAHGTLHVLEAARASEKKPLVLYASTNKVYGKMEHIKTVQKNTRHIYRDFPYGISESHPTDPHSPYGCSKAAADQYIRDYQRIYGLPTVVFRQSCIFCPRQFGIEDQGWVAWFVIRALRGEPIMIYGDGKQVRDVLAVKDLCRLYGYAVDNPDRVSGKVYNIGGGPKHTASLVETLDAIERMIGHPISRSHAAWRPGDQRVYVSDIRKIKRESGWKPEVSFEKGLAELIHWVRHESGLV